MPSISVLLPIFESVSAGFPASAGDYAGASLSLFELCIKNPLATFFVKVRGDSMNGAGIFDGDILIVDRSLEVVQGNVVVVTVGGEHTVKRFDRQGEQVFLLPENPEYAPILVEDLEGLVVWGVVTGSIRKRLTNAL